MRFFTWKNKRITDADLLVRIEDSEIEGVDAVFPEASKLCSHGDNAYFAFIDTERKLFIPMRLLSYAFGGMYNGYLPYGDEVTDTDINLKDLTWESETKLDKML